MPQITAKDVMNLRNRTGLPMMDCKQALEATGGDLAAAEEWLRAKLKGKMQGRTERAAGEGRIAIAVDERQGTAAIVELRAETDFAARSEKFVTCARRLAELALLAPGAGAISPTPEMLRLVDDLRISTGENCSLARAHKLIGETGTTAYGQYVHHDGKLGVLVQATGSVGDDTLREICMHIAAAPTRPVAITADQVPAPLVERERRIRQQQVAESGKPPAIAEKIIHDAVQKFLSEVSLLEQPWIRDPSKRVRDLLPRDARIEAFLRWQLGEQDESSQT